MQGQGRKFQERWGLELRTDENHVGAKWRIHWLTIWVIVDLEAEKVEVEHFGCLKLRCYAFELWEWFSVLA